MSLGNQYLILDSHFNNVGLLTVDGATKFTSDSISMQLADSDATSTEYDDDVSVGTEDNYQGTVNLNAQSKKFDHKGTVTVPQGQPDSDKVVSGNYLAYHDDYLNRWYVMYIYSTSEETTITSSVNTVAYVCNLMLRDLAFTIPIKSTVTSQNAEQVFSKVFQNSGWQVDYNTSNVNLVSTDMFDGKTKGTVLLQSAIQLFDVEIDAYVTINTQGKIVDKIVEITDELSSDIVYKEAIFGQNITNIKRTTVAAPITKLYAYGENGSTMAPHNNGATYIVDDDANQLYNYEGSLQGKYLEGVITANQISDNTGLKAWAQQMLKLFNHPRTYYEVNVAPGFLPPLGTTIRFKDDHITPALDATGRVIQRTISFASPYSSTIAFGEFVTVPVATPSWLTDYQSALEDAVSKALNDATAITPVLSHPDGLDFAQGETSKRLLLSAWVGKQNISTYVDSKGFAWRHVNTDGSIDPNWEQTGDIINVTPSLMGNIRAYIDGDYISEDPELSINQNNYVKIGEFDPYDSDVHRIAQHLEQLDDGTWYESAATSGDDCNFMHRDKNFKLIDKMVLTGGGHGTTFGVMYQEGQPWIICNQRNSSGNWDIVRFKYQGGKTLGINDTDHLITPGGYPRVVFDREHNVAGYSSGGYMFFVLNVSDLLAGVKTVMYTINMLDYDFVGDDDIFQGQALDFPYVYWSVGNQYLGKTCSFYCVNLLHRGEVMHPYYDTLIGLGLSNQIIEPESLSFATINGKKTLVHSFNVTPPDGNPPKKQMQYSTDIIYRPAMPVVNDDNNGSDDSDDVDDG
ncbi:tail protein [Lactobacillus phage Lenus]|uniref:Minor structural protein n=1 Tax=Lactobacillus phage Lenus TaxID=2053682 RepID=A0A2H4PBM7_9CAUD|nr:tail protein [Lactobacillus phage Lenus]ATW59519.1 hypothetical protein [Lactobacillus phage Lenus]